MDRRDSGLESDSCASVCFFAQLANDTAKGLNNTPLLNLMTAQNNVFIYDDKNHFTVLINEKHLSAMKTALEDVPDKPTIKKLPNLC